MKSITRLSTIISNYDALLLDLWGVVHDGSQLYPGVRETLEHVKKAKKKIIMLSNAPRRAMKAAKVLTQLGIEPALYEQVLTSGELGYQWLESGKAPWGKRYFYIGPSKDADILNGLDYKRTDDIKQCDFLLNVGFGSEQDSADDWQPVLRAAKAQTIPMLCLNPDFEVVKISGERFACAGVIAADYERLGGEVKYFGKPFADTYKYCLQSLKPIAKNRVLAIGDGIATDIAGAVGFGLDAVLVTGGIIKKESPAAVEVLCKELNAMPKYVMPALAW